jgi:hypothetical protein
MAQDEQRINGGGRADLVSAAMAGRLSRREIIRRATALGLSVPTITGLISMNARKAAARARAQAGPPLKMVG